MSAANKLLMLALTGLVAAALCALPFVAACSRQAESLKTVEYYDSLCWRNIGTGSVPPARFDHALAVDHPGRRIFMWGGRGRQGFLQDLWVHEPDGAGWREVPGDQSPAARSGHSLLFDQDAGRLVLFGGVSFMVSGELNLHRDLWFFNPDEGWSREFFSTGPSGRAWHAAMLTRGAMVIYGGFEGPPGYYLRDIWSFDLDRLSFSRIATDGGPLMAGSPVLLDMGGPSSLLAYGSSQFLVFGRNGMPRPDQTGVWSLRVELDEWTFRETHRPPDDDFTFAVTDSRKETILVARGPAEEDEDREWTLWLISGSGADWQEFSVQQGPAAAHGMRCAANPERDDGWICFGGAHRGQVSDQTWLLAPCAEEE